MTTLRRALAASSLVVCALASSARAQDGDFVTCADVVVRHPVREVAEWSWFLGGGGGVRGVGQAGSDTGFVRFGGEVDFDVGHIDRRREEDVDLRLGFFVLAESAFDGALAEGGLELDLRGHWPWQSGASWLRLGGGGGVSPWGTAAHVSLTYLTGLESAVARTETRGCCTNRPGSCETLPLPREHAYAPVARVFVTLRATFGDDRNGMVLLGVELDPVYLTAPYLGEELGLQ